MCSKDPVAFPLSSYLSKHTHTHTHTHTQTHTHTLSLFLSLSPSLSEPAGDLAHGEAESMPMLSEVELEMQVPTGMCSQYP